LEKKEGSLSSKFKVVTMVLHGFNSSETQKVQVNGTSLRFSEQTIRFFTSHFKFADFGPSDDKKVLTISFQNTEDKIIVNW